MSFDGRLLTAWNLEFPHACAKRRAALTASQDRILLETKEPQTGIFWWVPSKKGWQIIAFFDTQFGEPDHRKVWRMWANTILGKDDVHAPTNVALARCGLPRGRVRKIRPRRRGLGPTTPRWLIFHGNDSPVRNAVRLIVSRFNLPNDGYCLEFDHHECMLREDVATIAKYLGRDLGLLEKAADHN
jgi:hypothetical protein